MNKVLKGLVAVAATAAMAVAGFAGASTAMAAEGDVTITIGSETTPASVGDVYAGYRVCLTKLKPLLVRRPMLHTRSVLAGLTMIRLPTQLRLLTAVLP